MKPMDRSMAAIGCVVALVGFTALISFFILPILAFTGFVDISTAEIGMGLAFLITLFLGVVMTILKRNYKFKVSAHDKEMREMQMEDSKGISISAPSFNCVAASKAKNMFCTQCGTKLSSDAKFCSICGTPSS